MSVHAIPIAPETRTGLLGSLALHLAAALLLIFVAPKLIKAPRPVESVVPVEVVEMAPPASAPSEVTVPRPTAPRETPAKPRALPHLPEQPRAELPKQAAPEAPPSLAGLNLSMAPSAGARGSAAAGARPSGLYDVKDLIREQIERHWIFDRKKLPAGDRTVLLRVVINRDGSVAAAEILDDPEHGLDPAYQALARSARNAALLASPLTVPPERYNEVRDITLRMNPAVVSR